MDQPRSRHVPNTMSDNTVQCCGGTEPYPSLERLTMATAMPSSLRLGSGAVASATGPAPLSDHPPREKIHARKTGNRRELEDASGTRPDP